MNSTKLHSRAILKVKDMHILTFFLALIFYRLTLDYIYENAIAPQWKYNHFDLNFNFTSYYISVIWVIFIIAYDYKLYKDNRPSSNLLLFSDILFFIPLSSIIPYAGMSSSFLLYAIIYWIILSLLQLNNIKNKYDGYNNILPPNTSYYILAAIIIIANLFVTLYYNGFHIKLDLKDIYEIRFAVRDLNLPTLVRYLKPLASKVTLITIMILIVNKKYTWVIILSIFQLMNFAFGALKSDLFALLLVFIFGFFYKPQHRSYVIYGLVLFNLITICEFSYKGYSNIASYIHRRVLFMPSLLSFEYFEYFSSHELVYLRDSIMRFIGFNSPYPLEVPRLIGQVYYGSMESNCNTGLVGDDYAQLGWLGLLFFPLIRIFVLRIYDRTCETKINQSVVIFISLIYAISFISGSFFSILLTGGFIVILFLLHYYNPMKNMPKLKHTRAHRFK